MFTCKMIAYTGPSIGAPGSVKNEVLRQAVSVFVEHDDPHGRTVVGLEDTKGEIERYTVGQTDRNDVMFNLVYVMNDAGRTVETIR